MLWGKKTVVARVEGMTCNHCVKHVTEALAGSKVAVDLVPNGISRVTVKGKLDPQQVSQAITDAGYRVVDAVTA